LQHENTRRIAFPGDSARCNFFWRLLSARVPN